MHAALWNAQARLRFKSGVKPPHSKTAAP